MEHKQIIEEVEQAAMRLVVRAIKDFLPQAKEIFLQETDLPQDVAEDCTAEALQILGASNLRQRLFGKIDYKKAVWFFFADREQPVALFVDSKAEKPEGAETATIQLTQTSLEVRMIRKGQVMYEHEENHGYELKGIVVFCLPSGELQDEYNPNENKSFWRAGRNAPSRGEEFCVRVKLSELKNFAEWRVVKIDL